MKTVYDTSGTTLNAPASAFRRREKGLKKIFEEIIAENSLAWERK